MTRAARTTPPGVVRAKPVGSRLKIADGLFQGEGRAAAAQPPQQSFEYVQRLVADGEDFAGLLHLDGHALGLEQVDGVLDAQGREGGVEEATGRPVGGDDAGLVGGVGEVAARAAGHEDLDAGLAVLFQQQHAAAALGGADGGEQPGRTGPNHDDVPNHIRHEQAKPLQTRYTVSRPERLYCPRNGSRWFSFPGSAWERAACEAPPRVHSGGRASQAVRSQAEPGNEILLTPTSLFLERKAFHASSHLPVRRPDRGRRWSPSPPPGGSPWGPPSRRKTPNTPPARTCR